ncbi:GntR family transcriptional regulator [Mitsuaria sp. WAJ17]|uniref:GntR family transcriptional regulator n=1 Tax=Mitsuaria sp. WAJ17 TaxID=2761452 RepID=UPI001602BF6E|nr:GntR family transcriptional regulator [Mitsuaria sp. WAJ17]MBB2484621.1 GntR family transcriptional regulator [Mitsuaria sp. WAJ17]
MPSPSHRKAPAASLDGDSATDRIAAALTQAIIERRLMPGTRLAEQKLADLFQVSRTLVRQALNQLSRDRLVTLTPARGACVAEPSVEEARQVFELRRMLETQLARELAGRITPAQIRALRSHLREERAAVKRKDVSGRTRLLADFHVLLARLLGNEVLADLLQELLSRSSLIALMYQSSHSAAESQAGHEALVDALEAGDAARTEQLMLDHLGHVEAHLRLQQPSSDLRTALQL